MTRQEAVWHANHVFNIVIERCINAQNLKEAREFDEAKQIVIEALEQEPKRGHWTNEAGKPNDEQYSLYCSECKAWSEYRDRYCPNCGARMESEENGNG